MDNEKPKIIEIDDPLTGERSYKVACHKPGCFYEPTTEGFCDEHFSLAVENKETEAK